MALGSGPPAETAGAAIPDPHRQILDLLRDGPQHVTALEQTTGTDLTEPLAELRKWGWVFGDLELSGMGWFHARFLKGGILGST